VEELAGSAASAPSSVLESIGVTAVAAWARAVARWALALAERGGNAGRLGRDERIGLRLGGGAGGSG